MYRAFLPFALLLLLSLPKLAYATYPDVTGSYTGTLQGIDVDSSPASCPENGQAFTGSLSLSLQSDTNGNITGGSGTFVNNNDGEIDNFTVTSGGFIDPATFDIDFTTGDGSFGSILITVSGSTLTIVSGNVIDALVECDSIINGGTLTKGGSNIVSANTPSSTVIEAILFNTQVLTTISGISSRITGALTSVFGGLFPGFSENQFKMNGQTGLNAGEMFSVPYGVWGNYSYTDFENDFSATAFDGSSHNFLGGIDFQVWDRTILGVAFGFDSSDIDTGFNQGNQDADTITIAPYFGALLTDVLSVDFNLGYSHVDYEQYRTAGTTRITSKPIADRWFAAFNLNATKYVDRWIMGARVGTVYATSVIDDYFESNGTSVAESRTKVGSISLGGNLAYSFDEWEPFLNLSYQYDYQLQEISAATGPQPSNDKDDILLTTGLRYFESSGVSGNLEYSKRLTRDNYDEDRISLTVRIDY